MFVKQHSSTTELSSRTLFVTNAPIYPCIRTSIFLQAIFERYADVEKVLVAPKPKKDIENDVEASIEELTLAMFEKEIRSAGASNSLMLDKDSWCDQGRYAHVIFATAKDLKKFLNKTKKKKGDVDAVELGKLEIQELQDISHQFYEKEKMKIKAEFADGDGEKSDDESSNAEPEQLTGILALAQAHKDSNLPRVVLKRMCDQIMMKYEEDESEALRKQQEALAQPDEDGFVTVSYAAQVGDAVEFEKNGTLGSTGIGGGRRKRERSRSTKKNNVKGSDELQDFYRFQLKEKKKRSLEELKSRFQEDLKRVKQMKEDKMYRPF